MIRIHMCIDSGSSWDSRALQHHMLEGSDHLVKQQHTMLKIACVLFMNSFLQWIDLLYLSPILLFIIYTALQKDLDFVHRWLSKQFVVFSRLFVLSQHGMLLKSSLLQSLRYFHSQIIRPQVTFVGWNPIKAEGDAYYPVRSLSCPLSRAREALRRNILDAVIFKQDCFY